ncbi:MAG TPA: Maf family nucleotide pyrophosphatase [Hyphomicrobiaceae bacterium]|nr:Maf family nucleotide pyrophosphatase [Hyphomicrobiaceae bacterium]
MAERPARELVLASTSTFRRRMLEAAGVTFRVVPPEVDEAAIKQRLVSASAKPVPPPAVAEALARAKAEAVSTRLPEALVMGADQVLALGDELLGKPKDLSDARRQLERLRGKTHNLFSAAALAQGGKCLWAHVDTATLAMRPFSDRFLERYLAEQGESLCRMVGAYEIEGRGIQLFERVEGDTFAIVGLPLLPLLAELRARGAIAS